MGDLPNPIIVMFVIVQSGGGDFLLNLNKGVNNLIRPPSASATPPNPFEAISDFFSNMFNPKPTETKVVAEPPPKKIRRTGGEYYGLFMMKIDLQVAIIGHYLH